MIAQKLQLSFGTVKLLDRILIAELNEGILLDIETNRELLEIGKKAYNQQPYAYISNRIHSYAVNPLVYLEAANAENLKAIAVVTQNEVCKQNVQVEQKFYKNTNAFAVFEDLEEAIAWATERI